MGKDQIIYCIVALILGMLLFHMLSNVCGCKNVEGAVDTTITKNGQIPESVIPSPGGASAPLPIMFKGSASLTGTFTIDFTNMEVFDKKVGGHNLNIPMTNGKGTHEFGNHTHGGYLASGNVSVVLTADWKATITGNGTATTTSRWNPMPTLNETFNSGALQMY